MDAIEVFEMLHQFFKRSKCLTVWPLFDWREIYGKPSFWPSIGWDLERLAEVCAELNSWNILSRHHRHCEVLLAVWWCDPLQIGALTEDWRLKGAEIWTGTVGVATGRTRDHENMQKPWSQPLSHNRHRIVMNFPCFIIQKGSERQFLFPSAGFIVWYSLSPDGQASSNAKTRQLEF